jgi:hypothetical protein
MGTTKIPDHGFLLQTAHILEALATAQTIQERRNSLEFALVAFDHDDTATHDAAASGIALVTRCLQKHCYHHHHHSSATTDTHNNTITCLYVRLIGMLFRCSDEKAVKVVYHIGADLISLLVSLFDEHRHEQDVVASIQNLIARLSQLNISLPATDKKDLLVRLLQRVIRGEYECRPLQCAALQLTSGWTEHPDSKRYIMNLPGLVEDIVGVSLVQPAKELVLISKNSDIDMLPLHTVNCFRQLALDVRCKSELVHKKDFLRVILYLLNCKDTRSSAAVLATIDVLRQLATEAVCRVTICKHEKGAVLGALLKKMDSPELTPAVNQTLLRLIGHDTASFLLKKHTNIIERLTRSAQVDKDCRAGNEAPVLAAQALKRLASYVSVRNKAHPNLLDALTLLASAQNSQIRCWAVKGLYEQSKSSTGRFYIARTGNVLSTLIRLAKADPCASVKLSATEALLTLASDTTNAKRLASSSEVLETFAATAKNANECQSSARSAIQAILSLASHKAANKERVAKTLGLVESLSSYGVSQDTDNELKRAALHCVIVLAPLM